MSAAHDPIIDLSRKLFGTNGQHDTEGNNLYIYKSDTPPSSVREFPTEVFPQIIQQYIEDGAASLNVPPDMIAVPFLGFTAGAIGNTRVLRIKRDWVERANLWVAVIGDPGSGKSPAFDYARGPLDALQSGAWTRYQDETEQWEREQQEGKGTGDRPTLDHYLTTDATTEALANILSTSSGVAMVRDELVGWVKSHDAYKKGGDRQNYLSLWAGSPLKVDRAGQKTKFISTPCVPIVGGIQPDILPDLSDDQQRRDGFVERMLMCWPDARPIVWTDDQDESTSKRLVEIAFSALRLSEPTVILMTPEARQRFGEWYEHNGHLAQSLEGVVSGFYSKYPGQLGRIALVLHALHNPTSPSTLLDIETLEKAILVIEYFRDHLNRVLPRLASNGGTKGERLSKRILRVLKNADGAWVTRSELGQGLGNNVDANTLSEALADLESEGTIENREVPTGARPRLESRMRKRLVV